MTIRANSISFNTACIDGLEDAVYIQIMVDEGQKRIAIRKCEENDRDSVRWCIAKPDKRKTRKITGRFSNYIYQMMQWIDGCRYKILGHKINFRRTLYVLNCRIARFIKSE